MDQPLATDAQDTASEIVTDAVAVELDAPEVDPGHGALYTWTTLCLDGVYEYHVAQSDGTVKVVREWNSPGAVRDMAALAPRAPVTHLHPRDPVTPENFSRLSIGDAADAGITAEGEEETGPSGTSYKRLRALVPLAIRAARGQQAATTDARYVSPGYTPIREERAGVHPLDGPYDRVRVGVASVNHIALVPNPRGGKECGLALDGLSADEAQIALDSAQPMGYAVASAKLAAPLNLPSARRAVKQNLQEDAIMELSAFIALATEAFKLAQTDPSGSMMRELVSAMNYMDAFRAAIAQQAGRSLAQVVAPVGTTDADLPTDPAAMREALLSMVREIVAEQMKVKPEGSEVEISLGDACGGLMKDMAEMKAAMDAMKTRMDAMGAMEEKVAATDARVTKIEGDASTLRAEVTTATKTALDAKGATDALAVAEKTRLVKDAAERDAQRLASARDLAREFGMPALAADGSDLEGCIAHLRRKRVGYGATDSVETDSADDILARAKAALALRGRATAFATDAAQPAAPSLSPSAILS